jgi:hypothetical protein
MREKTDYSAELILVRNSLEAGGIERVVSTLANEWRRRGRRVCVVTMHDLPRALAAWESVVGIGGGNGNAAAAREARG